MSTVADSSHDRVKKATPDTINKKIDNETWKRVAAYVDKSSNEVTQRIQKLEKEWDIERYLGVNMSTLALTGTALAYFVDIAWLILPAVVLVFFFQHVVQGCCPPLPVLRSFKIRTRKEIEQEKYALKIIRGDFKNVQNISSHQVDKLRLAIKEN